jgi:hypothetical protein
MNFSKRVEGISKNCKILSMAKNLATLKDFKDSKEEGFGFRNTSTENKLSESFGVAYSVNKKRGREQECMHSSKPISGAVLSDYTTTSRAKNQRQRCSSW